MKILPIKNIFLSTKTNLYRGALLTLGFLSTQSLSSMQRKTNVDTFSRTTIDVEQNIIPSPMINISGEDVVVTLVIDVSENKLYRYDSEGNLLEKFDVATGRNAAPTKTGIRKIIHVESYPYTNSHPDTNRHNNPDIYGSKFIVLEIVNPITGKIEGYNNQFIHGTNEPTSIGTSSSSGCIRMLNEDIDLLSKQIKNGQYVLIKE